MSFFQFPRQSFIKNFRPNTVDAKAASPSGAATPAAAGVAN